ncbi:hypothetical protein KM043_018469 [Ampulex compressa]|nr:hypothetical protein KM043_018469 [Ampulex compressa]
MRPIAILLCVASALALASAEVFVDVIARAMSVPKSEVQKCVDQTGMTVDALTALDSLSDYKAGSPEDQEKATRTGCFITCIGHYRQTIEGAKLQVDKIHAITNERMPDNPQRTALHKTIDECAELVKDETDECAVSRDFHICIINKHGVGVGHIRNKQGAN